MTRSSRGSVRKTLFVGVFAYLIGNWNNLAKIVFESFAGLGLKGSGTSFDRAGSAAPRQASRRPAWMLADRCSIPSPV
jgi:type IV secretory pathway TrbL component